MKKIYNLLLVAVLLVWGATTMQAEKRYRVTGGDIQNYESVSIDNVGDLLDGTPFVLQSGKAVSGYRDFVRGTGKSTSITDANLFVLEADGNNAEGEPQYVLKRQSTGEYVVSGSYGFTSSKARAWRFCIFEPMAFTSDDINADLSVSIVEDWRNATTISGANAPQVVFVDAAASADTTVTNKTNVIYLCNGDEGKSPGFGRSFNANTWEIYTVEELIGADYLEDALAEILPDGIPEAYEPGVDPGQIPVDLYNALQEAYNTALGLQDSGSTDQAACEAAIDAINKALEAVKEGAIPVKEGYYFFQSSRTADNATYDDGQGLHWTYQQTWERPEVLDMANAKYVWHIIPKGDASKDGFYIENYYTKRYIDKTDAAGAYVKTTEKPEETFLIYPSAYPKRFVIQSTTLKENPIISPWAGNPELSALHCPEDHNNVVMWTPDADASAWTFLEVPADQIAALENYIVQDRLNKELQSLLDEAQADYNRGFVYSFLGGHNDGTLDMNGEEPAGLVTSVDQLSVNCQEASEGPLEEILDNNLDAGNFFHSDWHGDVFDHTAEYPYIQAELSKAVQRLSVKMWARLNGTNYMTNNLPGKVIVWATNDPEGEWTNVGTTNAEAAWGRPVYDESTGETTVSDNKTVGYFNIDMGAAYKYVRFEVTTRLGSTADFKGLGAGTGCFNMAEIRYFENAYSPELSMIEAVDPAVRSAFEAQMNAAKDALEAESATRELIESLQAAYDAFLDNYPDPEIVKAALAEAKAQLEAAEEGDKPGYFEAGAKAALETALNAVEGDVKAVMTLDEVKAAKEKIDAAMAAFNAKLVKPAAGKYYYVKSETASTQEGSAINSYLYASGNGARVKYHNVLDDTDVLLEQNPQYVWQLVQKGEGYVLRNMLTGEYMNNPKQNNAAVNMSTEADTCVFTFQSAKYPGAFNIVMDESVFANAQPATENLVTWNSAAGADNSAFSFVEVNEADAFDGHVTWNVKANGVSIVTLPVSVTSDGNCYSCLGVSTDGEHFELKTIDGTIEAGTPFFYIEADGYDAAIFEAQDNTLETLAANAATEAKEVNGLQGTLVATDVPVDYGVLYNDEIIASESSFKSVGNNSGYILPTVPTASESGDVQVKGHKPTAIQTVETNNANKVVNVYSLSGVKVRANVKSLNDLNGLPKGIYIMGNKKVLVK